MPEYSHRLARLAGAAREFAVSLIGYRGVFRVIARDHAALRTLLSRVISADGDDLRRAVLGELRRELAAHHRAEEAQLYPVLARIPETRDLASRAPDTHRALERRLDAIAARDVDTAGWLEEFADIAADIADHFAEEDWSVLWRSRDLVDDDHAEAMEALYEATQLQAR